MEQKQFYDTKRLVFLLQKQYPEEVEVAQNMARCKKGWWKNKAYFSFVSSENPNQPNSLWQFKTNLILEDEVEGTIIVDVLTENRIGGIEFWELLD